MPGERGNMPQLDGLRAAAVAAVLVYHWFTPPVALGQWGVTLFFVLSGYLITRNIDALRRAGMPLGSAARVFFLRRTLRLFPAFYLVVAIAAVLDEGVRRDWAWHVAYLSNILIEQRHQFGLLKPAWSLAVEEQFYVVWFVVVMCVPRRFMPAILAAGFVLEPLVRCAAIAPDHPGWRTWTLWANCGGLVAGAFLAQREASGRPLRVPPLAAAAAAIALGVLAALAPPQSALYSPLASVLVPALGAWVVWQARDPLPGLAGRLLAHRWVVGLGRMSYGVYLYHVLAPALVHALGLDRLPVLWLLFQPATVHGFVVHAAIAVGLAALSYRFLEMRLRNLAVARPRAAPGAAAT